MPVDMASEATASRSSASFAHVRECVAMQEAKDPQDRQHGRSVMMERL
jgi:hypothetical protein